VCLQGVDGFKAKANVAVPVHPRDPLAGKFQPVFLIHGPKGDGVSVRAFANNVKGTFDD
jgi:hypothetical protein